MDQSRFNVTRGVRLPPNVMMALAVVADLALILRGIFDVFQFRDSFVVVMFRISISLTLLLKLTL